MLHYPFDMVDFDSGVQYSLLLPPTWLQLLPPLVSFATFYQLNCCHYQCHTWMLLFNCGLGAMTTPVPLVPQNAVKGSGTLLYVSHSRIPSGVCPICHGKSSSLGCVHKVVCLVLHSENGSYCASYCVTAIGFLLVPTLWG